MPRRKTVLAVVACAVAPLPFASPASAQVTRLRVTQADNSLPGGERWLQLAEVEAVEAGSGTNVAASANGGVARASSSGFSTFPAMANDGNTSGQYAANTGSLWHSGASAVGEFWEVTFADPTEISAINLYGRSDCCQNRDNRLTVQLFDAGGTAVFTASNVALSPDVGQGFATIAVPEPASLGLLGFGAAALLARRRRG